MIECSKCGEDVRYCACDCNLCHCACITQSDLDSCDCGCHKILYENRAEFDVIHSGTVESRLEELERRIAELESKLLDSGLFTVEAP